MATFGERLRELRDEKLLTRQQLANAFGVSKNTIYVWEKDERMPAEDFNIYKAASYFGVSFMYLLGLSDIREEPDVRLSDEEAARTYDEEDLEDIVRAVKVFRNLSNEMQAMVRLSLYNAKKVDESRGALKSQQMSEDEEPADDKIIALFESEYFKKAVQAIFYPDNVEK